MTLAMAAQGDNTFFEGRISLNTERGASWIRTTIGEYLARNYQYLELLKSVGMTVEQVDEHHKELAKQAITQIIGESRNAVEQAALLAMVGTSMLATFDAVADMVDLNLSMFEVGGGNDN